LPLWLRQSGKPQQAGRETFFEEPFAHSN